MTKKNLAISLLIIWGVLLIHRMFFSNENKMVTHTENLTNREIQIEKKQEERTVNYPPLTDYRLKKDLFADLIKDTSKKPVQEEKKADIQPAPPLPLLPSPPVEVKEEPKEIQPDKLNEVVLIGIMDKKEKRFAFLKKGNDIKSLKKMDKIFDTGYIIEWIGKTEVIVSNEKGEKKVLKIDKEVNNEKKL